jgi:hypothetical protein
MPTSDDQVRAWIAGCTDRKDLESFAANAESKGRADLRDEARKRAWRLAGLNYSDSLDRDFHAMLAAYEHFLHEQHGRGVKASRTRMKLKNRGVVGCLEDWALDTKPTTGFLRLIEAGLAEFTGECVVVRHAHRFTAEAVNAARKRLEQHGVLDCGAKSA